MKRILPLALASALLLSACGGGKAQYPINVTATGVQYDSLVLATNGQTLTIGKETADMIAKAPNQDPTLAAQTATFPHTLSYGDVYDVTVVTQPPHQNCGVALGKDAAGRLTTINIPVTCNVLTFNVGGSVSGLTSGSVVLNGGTSAGQLTITSDMTSYKMPAPVPYNGTYGLAVVSQPAGLSCSLQNAVGKIGSDADVTNVNLVCTPAP